MNKAERISEQFGGDGQHFTDNAGRALETVCDAANILGRDTDGESIRWIFPDGSVITATDDGWDFGYSDCFCWQGGGHKGCLNDPESQAARDAELEESPGLVLARAWRRCQ